jgi:aryl-alcohol dehydrogenase-like predicted oxidoreductase
LATARRCTPSQLALAWLLAQGDDIVPIPGTTSASRLEENMGALQIDLSGEELRSIEAIAQKGVAAGERYPEQGMRLVNN